MGGPSPVYDGSGGPGCLFLVAGNGRMGIVKEFIAPFVIAFAAFCLLFLGLDFSIMKLQGLTLFFNP